jgi:hypothetical protein
VRGWQGGQVGAGRDAEVPQVGVELEEAAAGRSGVRRRLVLVASSRRMEWMTPARFERFFAAALRASRMGTLSDDSDARRSCSWWRAMWWNDRSMVAEECTEQSGAGGGMRSEMVFGFALQREAIRTALEAHAVGARSCG